MESITFHRPNPMLAPFIECLWYYQADVSRSQPDRLLPHGAFELVIGVGSESTDNLVAGPQTGSTIVDPTAYSPIAGAHFKPGGAAALFGHTARDFVNRDVPLDQICSRRARTLTERLREPATPEAVLLTLEDELTRYAPSAPEMHPSVALAISEFHGVLAPRPIRDLVDESGLSQRRFIELFTDRIGLTPKRYARIQRFQRVLTSVNQSSRPDWSRLAYESGYADQAHMIREFRELSGMRPTDYSPRWPGHPNHVPLP